MDNTEKATSDDTIAPNPVGSGSEELHITTTNSDHSLSTSETISAQTEPSSFEHEKPNDRDKKKHDLNSEDSLKDCYLKKFEDSCVPISTGTCNAVPYTSQSSTAKVIEEMDEAIKEVDREEKLIKQVIQDNRSRISKMISPKEILEVVERTFIFTRRTLRKVLKDISKETKSAIHEMRGLVISFNESLDLQIESPDLSEEVYNRILKEVLFRKRKMREIMNEKEVEFNRKTAFVLNDAKKLARDATDRVNVIVSSNATITKSLIMTAYLKIKNTERRDRLAEAHENVSEVPDEMAGKKKSKINSKYEVKKSGDSTKEEIMELDGEIDRKCISDEENSENSYDGSSDMGEHTKKVKSVPLSSGKNVFSKQSSENNYECKENIANGSGSTTMNEPSKLISSSNNEEIRLTETRRLSDIAETETIKVIGSNEASASSSDTSASSSEISRSSSEISISSGETSKSSSETSASSSEEPEVRGSNVRYDSGSVDVLLPNVVSNNDSTEASESSTDDSIDVTEPNKSSNKGESEITKESINEMKRKSFENLRSMELACLRSLNESSRLAEDSLIRAHDQCMKACRKIKIQALDGLHSLMLSAEGCLNRTEAMIDFNYRICQINSTKLNDPVLTMSIPIRELKTSMRCSNKSLDFESHFHAEETDNIVECALNETKVFLKSYMKETDVAVHTLLRVITRALNTTASELMFYKPLVY